MLAEGDLLLALTDLKQEAPILGCPAVVPCDGLYLHNQRLGLIVDVDEARVDRSYLFYLFCADSTRAQIRSSATGATVRHTAPERIYKVEVDLPSLSVQRSIAAVLSSIDGLISSNTRRIALLEESAQALYRERFAGRGDTAGRQPGLDGAEGGGLPAGWRWARLGDLVEEKRSAVAPSSVAADTPYIGLEHMPQRSIAISDWGRAEDAGSRKFEFAVGDVLFGKIRPYFHKVGVPPVPGICSTDALVLRPRDEELFGLVLAVVSSAAFVNHAVQTSQGTKMPRASWPVLGRYAVPVPDPVPLRGFNGYMRDTVALIHTLVLSNRNLRATRDLLLPRLISGEIDVSDLDLDVGEPAA